MVIKEKEFREMSFEEVLELIRKFNNEVYPKFGVNDKGNFCLLREDGTVYTTFPGSLNEYNYHDFLYNTSFMTEEEMEAAGIFQRDENGRKFY